MREIAHAAIDVSDGLIADLGHLASASGVRIVVEGEQVPLSAPLRACGAMRRCCAPSRPATTTRSPSPRRPGLEGPFTRIGRVEEGEGVELLIAGRKAVLPSGGYRHF